MVCCWNYRRFSVIFTKKISRDWTWFLFSIVKWNSLQSSWCTWKFKGIQFQDQHRRYFRNFNKQRRRAFNICQYNIKFIFRSWSWIWWHGILWLCLFANFSWWNTNYWMIYKFIAKILVKQFIKKMCIFH